MKCRAALTAIVGMAAALHSGASIANELPSTLAGLNTSRRVLNAELHSPHSRVEPSGDLRGPYDRVALAREMITLNVYVDRLKTEELKKKEGGVTHVVYDQQASPAGLRIRPATKTVVELWKGDGTIRKDSNGDSNALFDRAEFEPVMLVIDVTNEGARADHIAGAYIDIHESRTDRQPILVLTSNYDASCGQANFDPTFAFKNLGWGEVKNAKFTYVFGRASKVNKPSTGDIGSFEERRAATALPGLEAAGLDVARLKAAGFECASPAQLSACIDRIKQSGIFGDVLSSVNSDRNRLTVRTTGHIEYEWADDRGQLNQRKSALSIDLPLLTVKTGGEQSVCQGQGRTTPDPGPWSPWDDISTAALQVASMQVAQKKKAARKTRRDYAPVDLSLDRKSYRLGLSYQGAVAPRQNRRFALSLMAQRSSQHVLKVVLEMADGRTISSKSLDILYLKPNLSVGSH